MIIVAWFIAILSGEGDAISFLDFFLDKIYVNSETHYRDDEESTKLVFSGTGSE